MALRHGLAVFACAILCIAPSAVRAVTIVDDTWKDGTRTVTETRRLDLAAGDRVTAAFPTAVASAKGGEPARPALSADAGK